MALAERDGLREPNPYGHVPLRDNDPAQINEAYFQHVDWIVDRANALDDASKGYRRPGAR